VEDVDPAAAARGSRTPCPECGTVGAMTLGTRLVADPIGAKLQGGSTIKTTGTMRPAITCDPDQGGCGWSAYGHYTDRHFVVDEVVKPA
jgi:hypothetical protein